MNRKRKKEKLLLELPSRYDEVVTVMKQSDNPKVFYVITNSHYIRTIFDGDRKADFNELTIKAIDFEGGPFISLGKEDLFKGHFLKEIKYSEENKCYKFIFDDLPSDSEQSSVQ